jgi:hypothetical protein
MGSNSRKLGQPLVPQKSLELTVAAVDRRRIRRIADARPVTDDVAERVIMVCVTCAFWCAGIAEWAIAARSWVSFGTYSEAGNDGFWMSARRAGSGVWSLEPGRRVGLITRQLSPKVADSSNSRWSGVVRCCAVRSSPGTEGCGLSTESWLIRPPFRPHTPRRLARGGTRAHDPAVPQAADAI